MLLLWVLAHTALSGALTRPPQVADDKVVGEVVRFFRGGRTLVNGFVRVPNRMLSGVTGVGGFAVYSVELQVVDQSGMALTRDRWTRRVPWETRQVARSQSLEPFAFALAPGVYDVQVAVEDSGSGAREAIDLPVAGFAERPRASDLLLAYNIRPVTGNDSIPAASEVRKGDLLIAGGPDLTITPERPTLSYYCEAYRDSAGAVPWSVRVMGTDGRTIVKTATTETAVGAGGGQIAASLDLSGLPPGGYELVLVLGAGADTLRRAAPFRMSGFETAHDLVRAESSAVVDDRFSAASEAQLDSLAEPLVYVAKAGDLSVYRGLTYEGKQRFLRDFWKDRNPTPGTLRNDEEDAFYRRIAEANLRYREAGSARIPGWRTDRGRVFIKYGEPDDVRREPQTGPDLPWEAWKYTKGRALKFVFLDRTRLGNYSLVYSDDRSERNPEDWARLLSPDAVAEITSF